MESNQQPRAPLGIVIIGRNEGERLIACLKSISGSGAHIIYVDSGSSDGSATAAEALGANVLSLDMSRPFTAARARNAGYQQLKHQADPEFVQFIDGDCEIVDGWFEHAMAELKANPKVVCVCGRRREKFPEASLFNRLIDQEWATPVGDALSCGGDAIFRTSAFDAVGGYNDALIAGEEPELCVRLRANGGVIRRIDAEMTRHDAALTRLGQWLQRARRAGHAFAEVSFLHRGRPEGIWKKEAMRAIAWTTLPIAVVAAGAIIHPVLFAGLLIIPAQITRMAIRTAPDAPAPWAHASLIMAQKPWEAAGAIEYWINRLTGRKGVLIEYKSSGTEQ